MLRTSLRVSVFGLVVMAAIGCGGNVVVDATSAGGAGGAGGAGSGAGTPTTSGAGGTTGTTGTPTAKPDPATYCKSLCNTAVQSGCFGGSEAQDCVEGCLFAFKEYDECTKELATFYECAIAALSDDCSASGCEDESDLLNACIGGSTGTCEEYGCESGGGACNCAGECAGSELSVACKLVAGGYECACYQDGTYIAACLGDECGVFGSCCAAYFFPDQ